MLRFVKAYPCTNRTYTINPYRNRYRRAVYFRFKNNFGDYKVEIEYRRYWKREYGFCECVELRFPYCKPQSYVFVDRELSLSIINGNMRVREEFSPYEYISARRIKIAVLTRLVEYCVSELNGRSERRLPLKMLTNIVYLIRGRKAS